VSKCNLIILNAYSISYADVVVNCILLSANFKDE